MTRAYYNEFDPQAAAWLRELMRRGLIADGIVDERSIKEVKPNDLEGFEQVHLFAGIGGWSYALRLAGVPDDAPVWTGSCPCQPFSLAGKRKAQADDRHLWPEMHRLIRECRPERVFGEQVASAIGHGWLDGVFADLEGEGYACGATVLGAHSVGAPHIRQRCYWVAESERRGCERTEIPIRQPGQIQAASIARGVADGLAEPQGGGLAGRNGAGRGDGPEAANDCGLGDAWSDYEIVRCRDGKTRRAPSGVPLLAHGIPARVVRLRGYGNAIVPQVAAAFIEAALTTE